METKTNRLVIALCGLGAFCEGIDLQVAGVAAAGIVPAFKPDPQTLGTFFSASTFGLFFGALVGGQLSDRIGRKPVLVASIALFGIFSLITAACGSMSALTWARFATGLGLGGSFPIIVALTAEMSAANRRTANVAIVYSATPIGGGVVSLLSYLFAPTQWPWLFIVGGVAPLVVAVLMAKYLEESRELREAQALSSPGVVSESPAFVSVFAEGRALPTILLWVSFFLSLLTLYLLLNWLPTLLTNEGMSKGQASMAQLIFNLGGAATALLIAPLLEGAHRKIIVLIAFVSVPLALLALAFAPPEMSMIAIVALAIGGGVVSTQAVMYATAPSCYPVRIRGLGVGAAVAMGRTGSVAGPKLAGYLVAAGLSTSQLILNLVPLSVVAGFCAVTLVWKLTARAQADQKAS